MRVSAQLSFPAVQVRLRFFHALEAQPLQRRLLGMTDGALHLALSIRVADAAAMGGRAIVRQQIGVERIRDGVIDVGPEDAFAEIVQDEQTRGSAEPAPAPAMQFGPACECWNCR